VVQLRTHTKTTDKIHGEVTALPVSRNIFMAFLLLLLVSISAGATEPDQPAPSSPPPEAAKAQETGSIRLGDVDLVTEEYVVQEGDWLIKVLKKKGVASGRDVRKILKLLKELNSSFRDLNMIRPGEKIVILVKAGSSKEGEPLATSAMTEAVAKPPKLETPKPVIPKEIPGQLKYEAYKIKRGDSIGALAVARYELSRRQLYHRYFKLFKECNPSIKNLNKIFVGQKVKLPLFPPVRVASIEDSPSIPDLDNASDGRVAIDPVNAGTKIPDPVVTLKRKPAPSPEQPRVTKPPKRKPSPPAASKKAKKHPKPTKSKKKANTVYARIPYKPNDIGNIFTEMGSDWINSGEHFIPLKSGGQINLKASSYPVIRLNDGVTVILDLTGELPPDMSRFIQSTWNNYKIVRLDSGDDLRSSLDKLLEACGFTRAVKAGKPLLLGKDIRFEIMGDWILTVSGENADTDKEFTVLNLLSSPREYVPETVRNHLEMLRVHMIEYPPGVNPLDTHTSRSKVYSAKDRFELIEALLRLTGHPFSAREQIPAFMGQKEDFRLVINADFFVKTSTGNTIIDLTGLDPQIVSLLKKRVISVLSLTDEKDPLTITNRILDKLQVKSRKGPLRMETIHGAENKKVSITVPGIVFSNVDGNKVLVTPVDIPENISAYLQKKGYGLLLLSGFSTGGPPTVDRK